MKKILFIICLGMCLISMVNAADVLINVSLYNPLNGTTAFWNPLNLTYLITQTPNSTVSLYDDFEDGSVNTTIWKQENGGFTSSESAGLLAVGGASSCGSTGTSLASVNSTLLPSLSQIQAIEAIIRFKSEPATGGGTLGNTFTSSAIGYFGNQAFDQYTYTNTGSADVTYTYQLIRNGTSFLVYRDGTYYSSITPVNSNLTFFGKSVNVYGGSSCAGETTSQVWASYVYYNNISQNYNLTNATLYLSYLNGTTINVTKNDLNNNYNITKYPMYNLDQGNYKWGVYACSLGGSTTVCGFTGNYSFDYGFGELVTNYSYNVYETINDILNITFNLSSGTPTGKLWWDGTSYSATVSSLGGNAWKLEKNLSIPSGTGNKNLTWEINTGGFSFNSSVKTQIVNLTNFSLCSATNNINYVNFTFKNETASQESISATASTTWNYWLGSGDNVKSLSYVSASETPSYSFCLIPGTYSLKNNVTFIYDNAESQQRTYKPGNGIYTSTTNSTVLYLLPTSGGIYVTFQVINQAEQVITGASVTASKTGVGLVDSGTTDSSGIVTFWLDPLSTYTITASADGYSSVSSSITPSQTSYTITLGGASTTTATNDYSRGISYSITPLPQVLNNDTTYAFNYTLSSSYWTVTEFGYVISNGSYDIQAVGQSANGGALSALINTGQNKSFIMNYYWVIDGNYTNSTIVYSIADTSGDSWSIKTFVTDLKTYLSDGIFGLTSTGLVIIIFLFILIFTGIMSYKFALNSPAAIMFIVLMLVLIFDLGFGLLPRPASSNLPVTSILVGLIFAGTLFREVMR